MEDFLQQVLLRRLYMLVASLSASARGLDLPLPGHTPCRRCSRYRQGRVIPNGCTWSPDYRFKSCCDTHDFCYGSCNAAKSNCDRSFYSCMVSVCSRVSFVERGYCNNMASLYYNAVNTIGCRFYQNAQQGSQATCFCV